MDVAPTICMAATNDGSTPLSLPADSITIDSLLETVEKNTPYRFFSTISAPFKVLVKGKASPLQQLKEALEPTPINCQYPETIYSC